ncbi:hypothetical protein A3A75_03595 [Candidatus Woesebacteria bacterium RIFCSPLOWO2_01_FULL_39_10]|uniref:Glycosyltransferase RgtA/B/C/D-like domain-containing protein n=1 Tax=Candidatus Woesebacteria bacterium RIFCSPLOWO2_01_FULL_39_10 TaxID=1802516 RepID=A0A1F8BA79_9BACT|nr:MAG: hypothetical protein A3A75_03595 [Candidatus Woesebacteria bacterium RIFCSPLOWO2_01_FULL_39_10]
MKKIILKYKYYLILIFVIVLTKSVYSSGFGFNLVDEGEYLHNALRILNGDVPYRDFFSYQPPLYNYWNILAFKLLGISPFSARLVNSIFFSFVPVIFFLITIRFSDKLTTFVISIAFSFMVVNMESLYYHVFSFLGLFLFFWAKDQSKNKLFFSGALLGITALFRLDVGTLFFIGLIVGSLVANFRKGSLLKGLKENSLFFVGFCLPIFLMLTWMVENDLLHRFIRIQLDTPLQITSYNSLPLPKIREIIPGNLNPSTLFHSYETYVFYIILLTYFSFGVWLFKNWKKVRSSNQELIYFSVIAAISAPYMLGRADLGHIVKGGLAAFSIGAFLISRSGNLRRYLMFVPISFIVVGIAQVYWTSNFYNELVETNNGAIKLNRKWPVGTTLISAGTITKAINFIEENSNPSDTILVAPYMPGLYFLSNRQAKIYVGNILYTYLPDESEFIRELSEKNVRLIVYDPTNGSRNRYGAMKLRSYYPKLDSYIKENFSIVDTSYEGWLFMLRR